MRYDADDLAAIAAYTDPLDAAARAAGESTGMGTLKAAMLRPIGLRPFNIDALAEAQTRKGPIGTGHAWTPPAPAADLKGLGDDSARGRHQLSVALKIISNQKHRIAQLEAALRARGG